MITENKIDREKLLNELREIKPLLQTLDQYEEFLKPKALKPLLETLRKTISSLVYISSHEEQLKQNLLDDVRDTVNRDPFYE